MNKLPFDKRCAIISALVEGCSLRSTSRMVGVSINTVTKLLVDAGKSCARYQYHFLRNLPCKKLQVDEIWSFCHAKQKNVPEEKKNEFGWGDVWTFTGICAETKLVPCWLVGARDSCYATLFLKDLASRIRHKMQLTTDGHRMYLEAADDVFGMMVDYAQLVKIYGGPREDPANPSTRYSPGECCGADKHIITGNPAWDDISTSYVERQNLTMRMRMRRFTRLTNAFSKKLENLEWAVALHFMHYNYIRRHQTLRMPPALKAGVTDHLWTLEELVTMIDTPLSRIISN
jgi:IS1 family transposase